MSRRDRRALIIGSLVVALAWLGLRGIPDMMQRLGTLQDTVDQEAQLLRSAQERLSLLPQLGDSIMTLTGVADSLPSMLLAGSDTSAAEVDLMTRVRSSLEEVPVTIRGFERVGVEERSGPLVLTSVVVVLESDFRGVTEALEGLQGGLAVTVDALEITALNPHESGGMERLSARVTVSGWFRQVAPAQESVEAQG